MFLIIYTGEIHKVCDINIPAKMSTQCKHVEKSFMNMFFHCIKKHQFKPQTEVTSVDIQFCP